MSIIASRFAVLKVDEEADPSNRAKQQPQPSKGKPNGTQNAKSKSQLEKQKQASKKAAKKLTGAFIGTPAPGLVVDSNPPPVEKAKGKPKAKEAKQWDEWKEVDEQLVDKQYLNDLKEALLLSKATNKEKVVERSSTSPDPEGDHEPDGKAKKPKNKQKKTVSLNEFLDKSQKPGKKAEEKKPKASSATVSSASSSVSPENELMKTIKKEAENILRLDSEYSKEKNGSANETNVRFLEVQEELSRKDEEADLLRKEVDKLRGELSQVKLRNKKLCQILTLGEMKEKAEILVQVEKLTQIKDELTLQVSQLHGSLEQERSKVHGLQDELKKMQVSNLRKRNEDSVSK